MSESNSNTGKKLVRRREGRLVAGVCAGLASYFGLDVNLVRLLFGVFTIFYGLGVLVYVIAWAVVPEEGESDSIVEAFINKGRQ
ncbi:MAG: PspC domain-containing protein [Streptosporangiaceae bacterium]|jgi:phage shock protein C